MRRLLPLLLPLLLLALPARAAGPEEQARLMELERARAELADQVQLMAYDLVDELVYGWVQEPVFEHTTPVVLADVTVPVGLGTGLAALVENHVGTVIGANPTTQVQLVHCPQCTAVVVHSGPEGTVVSRGHDNPDLLEELGASTGQHALFIDIEAEGTALVLRARITRLTPELPIVWGRTIATSASTPALLRQPDQLKSASQARQEYVDLLEGRRHFDIPLRFCVRQYAQPDNMQGSPPPPFLWVQTGVEMGTTDSRTWTASFLFGASYIPQAYNGLMAQARVSRLITGRTRSLTRPDLYLFLGGGVMHVWGPGATSFQQQRVDITAYLAGIDNAQPHHTLGTLHMGVDLRVGRRMGLSFFAETLPAMKNTVNIGQYARVLGITVHSVGTEVSFWF